jgi:hypothetical protein
MEFERDFTKEEFENKLQKLQEWREVMSRAKKYVGFIPVPDKKKRIE